MTKKQFLFGPSTQEVGLRIDLVVAFQWKTGLHEDLDFGVFQCCRIDGKLTCRYKELMEKIRCLGIPYFRFGRCSIFCRLTGVLETPFVLVWLLGPFA